MQASILFLLLGLLALGESLPLTAPRDATGESSASRVLPFPLQHEELTSNRKTGAASDTAHVQPASSRQVLDPSNPSVEMLINYYNALAEEDNQAKITTEAALLEDLWLRVLDVYRNA